MKFGGQNDDLIIFGDLIINKAFDGLLDFDDLNRLLDVFELDVLDSGV